MPWVLNFELQLGGTRTAPSFHPHTWTLGTNPQLSIPSRVVAFKLGDNDQKQHYTRQCVRKQEVQRSQNSKLRQKRESSYTAFNFHLIRVSVAGDSEDLRSACLPRFIKSGLIPIHADIVTSPQVYNKKASSSRDSQHSEFGGSWRGGKKDRDRRSGGGKFNKDVFVLYSVKLTPSDSGTRALSAGRGKGMILSRIPCAGTADTGCNGIPYLTFHWALSSPFILASVKGLIMSDFASPAPSASLEDNSGHSSISCKLRVRLGFGYEGLSTGGYCAANLSPIVIRPIPTSAALHGVDASASTPASRFPSYKVPAPQNREATTLSVRDQEKLPPSHIIFGTRSFARWTEAIVATTPNQIRQLQFTNAMERLIQAHVCVEQSDSLEFETRKSHKSRIHLSHRPVRARNRRRTCKIAAMAGVVDEVEKIGYPELLRRTVARHRSGEAAR
ncbi:hypothetical protein K503DRAFT_859760 [Rhizopogon vinicolor AM-OR11-026]|uniref:Uncharacterized protein n=1 Tax=Rhizopogon vinicolor AM-OR11-026 TaxID=1314800 RepID=A0A1B7MLM5_9AGAM|nr:hypothetical protein K503DRAFT_859760 [Rhizopogon vinicolor AM-OR11-026]